MKRSHTILLTSLAATLFAGAAACVALTPEEKTAIKAGVAIACPFEALIPVVGFEFAAACPFEDKAVADALDGSPPPGVSTVAAPTDAGQPAHVAVMRSSARGTVCIGHGRPRSRKPQAMTLPVDAGTGAH